MENENIIKCVCCHSDMLAAHKSSNTRYFECKICGFWSTRDFDGQIPYGDYTDYQIGNADYTSEWPARVAEARKIMRHKFALVGLSEGVFLDIGCSEGYYVEAASSLGFDSYGVEIAGERVEVAKSRGLKIFSFEDYEVKKEFYDVVLLRHVIEHVPSFLDAITDGLKQLKVGGFLVIETPNQGAFLSRLRSNKIQQDRFVGHVYPPSHIHGFSLKAYEKIASRLEVKLHSLRTYSPADENWFFQSGYHEGHIKKFAHRLLALMGEGENLCAIMRRSH